MEFCSLIIRTIKSGLKEVWNRRQLTKKNWRSIYRVDQLFHPDLVRIQREDDALDPSLMNLVRDVSQNTAFLADAMENFTLATNHANWFSDLWNAHR